MTEENTFVPYDRCQSNGVPVARMKSVPVLPKSTGPTRDAMYDARQASREISDHLEAASVVPEASWSGAGRDAYQQRVHLYAVGSYYASNALGLIYDALESATQTLEGSEGRLAAVNHEGTIAGNKEQAQSAADRAFQEHTSLAVNLKEQADAVRQGVAALRGVTEQLKRTNASVQDTPFDMTLKPNSNDVSSFTSSDKAPGGSGLVVPAATTQTATGSVRPPDGVVSVTPPTPVTPTPPAPVVTPPPAPVPPAPTVPPAPPVPPEPVSSIFPTGTRVAALLSVVAIAAPKAIPSGTYSKDPDANGNFTVTAPGHAPVAIAPPDDLRGNPTGAVEAAWPKIYPGSNDPRDVMTVITGKNAESLSVNHVSDAVLASRAGMSSDSRAVIAFDEGHGYSAIVGSGTNQSGAATVTIRSLSAAGKPVDRVMTMAEFRGTFERIITTGP